jgi:glutamyl-tRNA synthetase
MITPFAEAKGYTTDKKHLAEVCRLMKERASFTKDIVESGSYLFEKPLVYDEQTVKKKWKEDTGSRMEALSARFAAEDNYGAGHLEEVFKAFLEEESLGMGAVLPNLRLLLTGEGMGPGLFDIMALLGKEECLERMKLGIQNIDDATH